MSICYFSVRYTAYILRNLSSFISCVSTFNRESRNHLMPRNIFSVTISWMQEISVSWTYSHHSSFLLYSLWDITARQRKVIQKNGLWRHPNSYYTAHLFSFIFWVWSREKDLKPHATQDPESQPKMSEKRLLALRIYYLHPLVLSLFIIWFQHLLVFF